MNNKKKTTMISLLVILELFLIGDILDIYFIKHQLLPQTVTLASLGCALLLILISNKKTDF